MADKKKTGTDIVSEMVSLIVGHLEGMPVDEREERIKALKEVINRGAKRARAHPKATSDFRTRQKSSQ